MWFVAADAFRKYERTKRTRIFWVERRRPNTSSRTISTSSMRISLNWDMVRTSQWDKLVDCLLDAAGKKLFGYICLPHTQTLGAQGKKCAEYSTTDGGVPWQRPVVTLWTVDTPRTIDDWIESAMSKHNSFFALSVVNRILKIYIYYIYSPCHTKPSRLGHFYQSIACLIGHRIRIDNAANKADRNSLFANIWKFHERISMNNRNNFEASQMKCS